MKKFLTILLLLIANQTWCNNYCEDVFDRLVNNSGNLYASRPKLVVVNSDLLVAETYSNGEIKVGSRLINLCRRFGADSTNAIAHVLSHELAHYYLNHSWMSNFTSAYANVEWSQKLNENELGMVPVYETQADEMGFFYALNAGFNTGRISSQILDSIYNWYHIPENLKGYPPLDQRKSIATSASGKIRSLTPVFKISNYFTLIGKYYSGESQFVYYQSSGYCLDHLVHENLKTPGILNNLGVIYFLQAQPSFYEPMNKLMYPVMLDENPSFMDMSEMVNTKGLTPTSDELSKEALDLLSRSKDAFEQALKTNKQYLPAQLNVALVHFVLKEQGTLMDKMNLLKKLDIRTDNSAYTVYQQVNAFYYYLKGDAKKMKDAFKKSIETGDISAQWNNEVLSKTTSNTNEMLNSLKWTVDTTEQISGKKVYDFFKTFRSSQETRLDPYHQQFILWTDEKEDGTLYTFRSLFAQTVYRDLMFFEVNRSGFQTSKGVKLGSHKDEVEKLYGTAYCKNQTFQGYLFLYPSQSMIVTLDNNTNQVTGITYYGIKK